MIFERDNFANDGEEAVQLRPVTVRDASIAFNTTDAVIREAVEDAHWILVTGPGDDPTKQRLELDGA